MDVQRLPQVNLTGGESILSFQTPACLPIQDSILGVALLGNFYKNEKCIPQGRAIPSNLFCLANAASNPPKKDFQCYP